MITFLFICHIQWHTGCLNYFVHEPTQDAAELRVEGVIDGFILSGNVMDNVSFTCKRSK